VLSTEKRSSGRVSSVGSRARSFSISLSPSENRLAEADEVVSDDSVASKEVVSAIGVLMIAELSDDAGEEAASNMARSQSSLENAGRFGSRVGLLMF
jgi:hypothetical protein